jgi:hypothetical protein
VIATICGKAARDSLSQQLPAVLACVENCLRRDGAALAGGAVLLVPQFLTAVPIKNVNLISSRYRLIAGTLTSSSVDLRVEQLFAWSQAVFEVGVL